METVVKSKKSPLAWVNIVLVVLIVAINGYVLAAPQIPRIELWRHKRQTNAVAGLPYKTTLDAHSTAPRKDTPSDNRLVIPKIALDEHIYTGDSAYLVNKGVWARPNTSTPPKGGNTVLVGHRFTYDGPATFYSLDKVAKGDNIVVYWEGKEYDYQVETISVVPPTAIEVEAPTKDAQLTLYTCTPLWSAKNRLVIVSKLTTQEQKHE